MVDAYAIMGNPVEKSLSPFIHAQFAKQTHQHIRYTRIEVPLDKFAQQVKLFQLERGKGLNITVPFKQQAYHLVTERSARAEIAQAVNTIKFLTGEGLLGDNTDGIGWLRDLTINHQYTIAGKRVLIIGAGGAVRGLLAPLFEARPKEVMIANRTLATAIQLTEAFSQFGLKCSSFEALEGEYDLVIHGTSSTKSFELAVPTTIFSTKAVCYDLSYSQHLTPFLQWSRRQGVNRLMDGMGMLVEQAAESFYLWRGIRPSTQPVLALLRAKQPAVLRNQFAV